MDLSQLVGYILTAIALYFMMGRKPQKESEESGSEAEQQTQKLKDFLRLLEDDMKKPDVPKPLKIKPKVPIIPKVQPKKLEPVGQRDLTDIDDREYKTAIESRKYQTAIKDTYQAQKMAISDAPAYHVTGKQKASRASQLLSQLPSNKQMVLLHEIFGKPKGL